MAESLTQQLFAQLQGAPMQQMSSQLGIGEQQTSQAIADRYRFVAFYRIHLGATPR